MAKFNYFELDEFLRSDTAERRGIDNTPTFEIVDHLGELVEKFLDPLRAALGNPIVVTSGYRCPALNRAVGGAQASVHMKGYAADIHCPKMAFDDFRAFVIEWVQRTGTKFDQILLERSLSAGTQWLHIGLYNNAWQQRGEIKAMTVQ